MLESYLQKDNSFVTLTYDDESLIYSKGYKCGLPTVYAKDVVDWVKRFRKRVHPIRIRYFAVGEYGDLSGRPHYHVALFGWPGCADSVLSRFHDQGRCVTCSKVVETWRFGRVQVGELSFYSAQYIAGYTTKKLTRRDDERLDGREPEFARMSRMPGLGRGFLEFVHEGCLPYGDEIHGRVGDAPGALRHGAKIFPMGRYLRGKLREKLEVVDRDGVIGSGNAPEATFAEAQRKLQELSKNARAVAEEAPPRVRREIFEAQFKENIVREFEGGALRLEFRQKLKNGRTL